MEILENKNIDLTSSFATKRKLISDFCDLAKAQNEYDRLKNSIRESRSKLDAFLKSLAHDYFKIFTRNFLSKEDTYGSWYLNHWSKSTYYKKLNYVANLFLRFINDMK